MGKMDDNTKQDILIDFNWKEPIQSASDAEVVAISFRLIQNNRETYETLAM